MKYPFSQPYFHSIFGSVITHKQLYIMKKQQREIVFLRTFAVTVALGLFAFLSYSFKSGNPFDQKFGTIDVERINVVEKDGTVKMVITNVEHFPTKGDSINGREFHKRKKRAGMLFFNEEGTECGGFIYDGTKNEKGHSAGLALSYDQFNGDQVMQLISTDRAKDGKRFKSGRLVFNDRRDDQTITSVNKIIAEIKAIKDPVERRKKYAQYAKEGHLGATHRVILGQTPGKQNGLFLYDDKGNSRAKFCIDKDNNVKLEVYDEKGNVVSSWPNK